MTRKHRWKSSVFIFITLFQLISCLHSHDTIPSQRFTQHRVVRTKLVHGRSKRELRNTLDEYGQHHHNHVELHVDLNNRPCVVDLSLNRGLLTADFALHTHLNGTVRVDKSQDIEELCHYQGTIRGLIGSWAAVSTCDGVLGVINDGHKNFYLQPNSTDGFVIVYDDDHLNHSANHSCGFPDTPTFHRFRREAVEIRGPYNGNRLSRYVELVLVVDKDEYAELGADIHKVYRHCKDIANIINSLFAPLNIFVALVGVVVWTEQNEIVLSPNGDVTLTNFLHYRKERLVKQHPNDNAQLLTRIKFDGGVVGKALKGPICTYEFSGGVSMDHSTVVGLVATTVAHEMGHNFGMEHDTAECKCPDEKCIMAPSSSPISPSHWSSCSLDYLSSAFEHGMDYCLRNKPKQLFESPVCGNGFVEPGEQCDCGLPHMCDNKCCNAATCMLQVNASCATGVCCDFQTCRPKGAGTACRSAEHECDLPEFCTGDSEYCPADVYKLDGETCNRGKAFCYEGKCRTHSDQCKLLWGPSGKNSELECYDMNKKGTRNGNCGYNRVNQSYVKCVDEHVFCGMLHCIHLNERLEFGMESVSILAHSFINRGGSIVPCRNAIVDLGLNVQDPGLTPDGAKCADDKLCVNQKCMSVGDLRTMQKTSCPKDCNGNGVCNSKGHCHCFKGYAPPHCDFPGYGGSIDSGPASDPNGARDFTTALYIIFLGIVPGLALSALIILYLKKDPRLRWKAQSLRPSTLIETKRHSPKKDDGSLLPAQNPTPEPQLQPDASTAMSQVQKDLIGQFKGFSIKAIEKDEDDAYVTANLLNNGTSPAVAVVKPISIRAQNRFSNGICVVQPPSAPEVTFKPKMTNPKPVKYPPEATVHLVDTPKIPVNTRPEISSPVLEGTTSSLVPTRKAPDIPVKEPEIAVKMSVPDRPAPAPPEFPTLTRIANLMRNSSKKDVKPKIRIDREKLKNIEISNPIPVVENITGNSTLVKRSQSMRDPNQPKPPTTLVSFGSMRGGANRPVSIHVPNRPKSPPPQPPERPPPIPPTPDYPYDDCLNVEKPSVAPLAHIEENSPTDNIYAVIEDNRYEVPKTPEKVSSGSTESMGLLGEIVGEIQSRNLESIYSSGTLKRKKEEKDREKEVYHPSDVSSNSSNGYLSPKKINSPTEKPSIEKAKLPPTYKPYSSSVARGPLSATFSTSAPRMGILSTPTPPKFTPRDITCSLQGETKRAPSTRTPPKVAPRPVISPKPDVHRPLPKKPEIAALK